MAQGTSIDSAWSIAQGGFGIAASLDEGFYGSGEQESKKGKEKKTKQKKQNKRKENKKIVGQVKNQNQPKPKPRNLSDKFL